MGGIPLEGSDHSLHLALRHRGDLPVLPRNEDKLSCKLQKGRCFLKEMFSFALELPSVARGL